MQPWHWTPQRERWVNKYAGLILFSPSNPANALTGQTNREPMGGVAWWSCPSTRAQDKVEKAEEWIWEGKQVDQIWI